MRYLKNVVLVDIYVKQRNLVNICSIEINMTCVAIQET